MKKYIIDTNIWGRTDKFEIVNEFPDGYQVWNIGRHNFKHAKYLPLCAKSDDFKVDLSTLKAIKMPTEKQAARILKAAGCGTIDKNNYLAQ